jgi:hypothetical protein
MDITPISTDGGYEPLWSRDAKELFYRSGDKMMVVTIETEPEFKASTPRELFKGQFRGSATLFYHSYAIFRYKGSGSSQMKTMTVSAEEFNGPILPCQAQTCRKSLKTRQGIRWQGVPGDDHPDLKCSKTLAILPLIW